MAGLRIGVLGPLVVKLDGEPVKLRPINARTLIRLLLAKGRAVPAETIYRDVWETGAGEPVGDGRKAQVQKQIFELRRALDPGHSGESSVVIPTDRSPTLAYKLVVAREQVDAWAFEDLVDEAQGADPVVAVPVLRRALQVWRGQALMDVRDRAFAESARRRLDAMQVSAQRRLLDALLATGLADDARSLARLIIEERPEDDAAYAVLEQLSPEPSCREQILLTHAFDQPCVNIVLAVGDLLARSTADLVVGFSDTFDTSIKGDLLVYRHTIQGQLLTRLYQGDQKRLDRDLERALAEVPEAGRETRADKRRGKLTRYPLGTVAKVEDPQGAPRRIFCVAYSRMSNDAVSRSSPEALQRSLDELWRSVYRFGQFGELAIPLVGSGRSRIDSLTYQELLALLASSFVAACRQFPVCRELRIMLSREHAQRISVTAFGELLQQL